MKKKHSTIVFELKEEYIELIRLLKFLSIAENGAHAKWLVEEELVSLNGFVELRKRAKLRKGDIVTLSDTEIKIQ